MIIIEHVLMTAYFFDMIPMDACTTRHWQTSGRLVQALNVSTAHKQSETPQCVNISEQL